MKLLMIIVVLMCHAFCIIISSQNKRVRELEELDIKYS